MENEKIVVYNTSLIENFPYGATYILPPNFPHKSTFYKITYFYDGECELVLYSKKKGKIKKVKVKKGDAYIVTPDDIHSFILKNPTNYCHKDIYIKTEDMNSICDKVSKDLYDEINNLEYPPIFRLSNNTMYSISELHSLISFKPKSDENDIIYHILLNYILGQYLIAKNTDNSYPKWLKNLLNNLEKEDEFNKPIEEITKNTNYSHGYICRQFKKYLNMSLKEYIIKTKLYYASNMLTSTEYSLEDITEKLNFSTVSNFIYLFKKEYNTTPGKYKKEHKMIK